MTSYTALEVVRLSNESRIRPDPGELAARVAAGDREAFVSVYRAHFADLRAFARRLLGCPMAADDLVHEVFLALPSALGRFRGECPLRSFLLSIAVRSARGHLRAAQRRRRLDAELVRDAVPSAAPGTPSAPPDADFEQRELARLLDQALDALPLDQRVAFVLCEIEERSSAEVAEVLGEKAGTVRARVFHAKKKLRARLSELAPERHAEGLEVEP